METREKLKKGRDLLLKLHKTFIDHERGVYENINGPLNAGQFLNVLLEDNDFAWLRKFSMLIVEIDEMFDLKDAIPNDVVDANLDKLRELVAIKDEDEYFRAKYTAGLQQSSDAAGLQSELKHLLAADGD